jgi:uncharacterized protein (TIGR02284 family)
MPDDNKAAMEALNGLIETCKDGEEGFRVAAASVKNSELKTLFGSYARQRAQFVAELQKAVRELGGDPEQSGSLGGTIHRGWINLRSAVTGKHDAAMIAECERGEDMAKRNYEDALKKHLPAGLQGLVQRQYSGVKESHDRVRALQLATSGNP